MQTAQVVVIFKLDHLAPWCWMVMHITEDCKIWMRFTNKSNMLDNNAYVIIRYANSIHLLQTIDIMHMQADRRSCSFNAWKLKSFLVINKLATIEKSLQMIPKFWNRLFDWHLFPGQSFIQKFKRAFLHQAPKVSVSELSTLVQDSNEDQEHSYKKECRSVCTRSYRDPFTQASSL